MAVIDINGNNNTLLSSDPVETARTLVRLRSKTNNLGDVVYGFAGTDPEDGVDKEVVLTLTDLTALTDRIDMLQAKVWGETEARREIARLRAEVAGHEGDLAEARDLAYIVGSDS